MAGEQPLYVMIKPPPGIADEIACRRHLLDIDGSYGAARFHCTVLPLGEGRSIAPARLDRLIGILASLHAEPFRISLDTLRRNALTGKANGIRTLRKTLKRHLAEARLPVSGYDSHPHLSIAYGPAPERKLAVPPIAWIAEDFRLIRSIRGVGRHEELGCWPLVSRQGSFGF
jgi:2'-5' RNA ligase